MGPMQQRHMKMSSDPTYKLRAFAEICEADGGGWGPAAHKVWTDLAKHKSIISGETDSIIVNRLLQSLGLILHRENARSILRRSPGNTDTDISELLATSVACMT